MGSNATSVMQPAKGSKNASVAFRDQPGQTSPLLADAARLDARERGGLLFDVVRSIRRPQRYYALVLVEYMAGHRDRFFVAPITNPLFRSCVAVSFTNRP